MMDTIKDVAGSAVDGLKQQPLLLAMVMLQVILLGVVAWTSAQTRTADKDRFLAVMQLCGPRSSDFKLQSDESVPVQ